MADLKVLDESTNLTELDPNVVLTDDNIPEDMAKEYEDGKGGED